jgi:hypothetical protein
MNVHIGQSGLLLYVALSCLVPPSTTGRGLMDFMVIIVKAHERIRRDQIVEIHSEGKECIMRRLTRDTSIRHVNVPELMHGCRIRIYRRGA